MAAKSNNMYDTYNWIVEIYNSCETAAHLLSADRLSRNHLNLFGDSYLRWELLGHRSYTYNRITRITD